MRYRPAAAADLAAHGETLRLLALDLADLPAARLERAINAWVRTERWMPKAADLVALCKQDQQRGIEVTYQPTTDRAGVEAFVNARNAGAMAGRSDIEWFVDDGGNAALRYKREPLPGIVPIHPDDVELRNGSLTRMGATFRYDFAGHRRDLTDDEEEHRQRMGGGIMPWQR